MIRGWVNFFYMPYPTIFFSKRKILWNRTKQQTLIFQTNAAKRHTTSEVPSFCPSVSTLEVDGWRLVSVLLTLPSHDQSLSEISLVLYKTGVENSERKYIYFVFSLIKKFKFVLGMSS